MDATYARQLAEKKAKEAGLSKAEITAAGKAAVTDYFKNVSQFKSAQEAELIALRDLRTKGEVTTAQINAEKKANATEYNNFIKQYFDGLVGTPAGQTPDQLRSTAVAYSGETADKVTGLLDSAAQKYEELNIPTRGKVGDTVTGLGLHNLVSYDLGQTNAGDTALINRGETYVGNTFTPEQLKAQGVNVTEVKGAPGVYQWSVGGGETKNIVYFQQNADGSFTGSGINRGYTPQPQDNGFLGMGNVATSLALAGLGYFGGPALANAVGTSGAVANVVAGALLGATASEIGGYDPLAGAIKAGFAAYGAGTTSDTGAFDIAGNPDILGGDSAIALGNVTTGAFDLGGNPDILYQPKVDYSLLGDAKFPVKPEGMGGGTGLTSDLPPVPEADVIGTQPIDYTLSPQITPGAPGGIGLQQPTMPNLESMGGGQGLTVPVTGGNVGELGFTPTGATPSLGDPSSFINNPAILGTDVIAQGTSTPIPITDILRGANALNNLLSGGEQQQVAGTQGMVQTGGPTGVDYSALLGLLGSRVRGSGLLGTQFQPPAINLATLLR